MALSALDISQLERDRAQVETQLSNFYRDTKAAWRVKTIINRNPYLTNNMDAVIQMANMPISDDELFANAGAMFGMQSTDSLASQMQRYTPSVQRSIFVNLLPGQQQSLRQLGYEPPKNDVKNGGLLDAIFDGPLEIVGDAIGFVTKGIGPKVMPVVSPALNLMDAASDFIVGRPYRTIRQLGTDAQIAGLIGGLAGAAGVILAPVTGGTSLGLTLTTLGLVGAGAAAGASAASFLEQTITGNPDDWFNAWSRAGNGEKLFKNSGVRKASEILGDPRLVNMAQKIALELDSETTLIDLAQDIAGVEGSMNPDVRQKQLAKVAKEFATEGTPEYQSVYSGLSSLLSDPLFQEALKVLEQSKISFGRDVAGLVFDEDSDMYRYVSGGLDAASVIILDPFLLMGKAARSVAYLKRGIKDVEAASAAVRFREIAQRPEVNRVFQVVADAVNTGSTSQIKKYTPWMMPVWNELLAHRNSPEILKQVAARGKFDADDVVDWVVGFNQMKAVMQGTGLVAGVSHGMLKGLNRFQYAMRTGKGALGDFMQGAADLAAEQALVKLTDNPEALRKLIELLPPEWATHFANVSVKELPDLFAKMSSSSVDETGQLVSDLVRKSGGEQSEAYALGRKYAAIPGLKTVGSLYESITTLVPRGSIINLDPLSADSVSDINAFVDLFKVAKVPSYARELWKRAIFDAPDIGRRMDAVASMIDSFATSTGIRATREGDEMLREFLERFKQEYALGSTGRFTLGSIDDVPLGTLPEADAAQMMQIPDLTTMRQAVKQGTVMRVLMGIPDSTVINAFQNKFWKPSVLLRFGFVVRNGTEDLLAFISRAGMGHFTQQFGARSIAQRQLFQEAKLAVQQSGDAVRLTPQQFYAMKRNYDVPAHLRPVARIIEKFGTSGSPGLKHLSDYGTWLRQRLLYGAFGGPQEKRGVIGRQEWLENAVRRLTTKGEASSGWSLELPILKENLRQNLDAIFMGNEFSARRMLAGGVDRQLVRSAYAFESKYLGPIMQRVGASSILPWQTEVDGGQFIERQIPDAKGDLKTVHLVPVKGERTFTSLDGGGDGFADDLYHAVHKRVTRLTEDTPASRILMQISKTYDASMRQALPVEQLDEIFDAWFNIRLLKESGASQDFVQLAFILSEPGDDARRFQAYLAERKQELGALGEVIGFLYPGMSKPSIEEFLKILPEFKNEKTNIAFAKLIRSLNNVQTPTARNWILQTLNTDLQLGGKHISRSDYTRWVNARRKGVMGDEADTLSPFNHSLQEALDRGVEDLTDDINNGLLDDLFSKGMDYQPGAWGRKHFVIQPAQAAKGRISNDILAAESLINSDGTVNTLEFARLLNVDISRMKPEAIGEFNKFASSFVNSLRDGNPFILSEENAARILNQVTRKIHTKYLNLQINDYRSTWLPIDESKGQTLSSVYPELATRTGKFFSESTRGRPISGVAWDANVYPTPEIFLNEAPGLTVPQRTVQRLRETVEQGVRGGRRTKMQVRDNVTLYMNFNGKAMPVQAGTIFDRHAELFADPEFKRAVSVGNKEFFKSTDVVYEGNDEIMWGILGPVLYDMAEELGGRTVRAVKSSKERMGAKVFEEIGDLRETVLLPTDSVRIRHSKVEDVKDTPGEVLPNWEISQVYEPMMKGAWDRFVNFGFNRVMSPILDGIARRPMAFHAFQNAWRRNYQSVSWLFQGTDEDRAVSGIINRLAQENVVSTKPVSKTFFPRSAEAGRMAAQVHGVRESMYWNDQQAVAFLRSLSQEEATALGAQIDAAIASGNLGLPKAKAKALAKFADQNLATIQSYYPDDGFTSWAFLDRIDAFFGEGSVANGRVMDTFELDRRRKILSAGRVEVMQNDPILKLVDSLSEKDWQTIKQAGRARENAYSQAEEYAAEYAIKDIMPFIDTHEVRSQFADWARGYLPFWYAEENFLKRWARIFSLDGPAGTLMRARQLQLTANGLRTMGVVRTDAQGNSYFVYPGSDLLIEAVSKIPGLDLVPVAAMLQTPTERMIPGFNPNFGAAGFSPLVGLPVEFMTVMFPESSAVRNFQRNVTGDIAINQEIVNMIFPAQVVNTLKAVYEATSSYDSQGNERVMSAMMSAIANLEAQGKGLPDDATASEVDDFLRLVRRHARVIVLSQAIAGWFTPGPAQPLQGPEGMNSISWLTEGQISNPSEFMSSTYFELIRNLGIEEGTYQYLERFPEDTVENILNPMAFTVSRTSSRSGAPLPSTDDGIRFYEENRGVLEQYNYAGPWLLPQDYLEQDERSQYAYDVQMIDGLRTRKTPEEFMRELKFREGSSVYFRARKEYLDEYARLKETNNSQAKSLKMKWDLFSQYWQASHPIFAEELTNADARQRRANVITEMRTLLDDPLAPQASHFGAMKVLMESYDTFTVERSRLSLNKSGYGRAQVEILKKNFEEWVTRFTAENPAINSFWLTVLRPETGLD